jgi:carbon-monoxide dehydrogenase small subunit
MAKELHFVLNGQPVALLVNPSAMLVEVLRDQLDLTGTKVGCNDGDCGSCTVLIDNEPFASCLVPAYKVEGREVLTVEGLAQGEQLHPLQEAFLDEGAVQCGFCIPGMLLSAKALLDRNPNPSRKEIRAAIAGNLCRCTGYEQIIDAVQLAARHIRQGDGSGGERD